MGRCKHVPARRGWVMRHGLGPIGPDCTPSEKLPRYRRRKGRVGNSDVSELLGYLRLCRLLCHSHRHRGGAVAADARDAGLRARRPEAERGYLGPERELVGGQQRLHAGGAGAGVRGRRDDAVAGRERLTGGGAVLDGTGQTSAALHLRRRKLPDHLGVSGEAVRRPHGGAAVAGSGRHAVFRHHLHLVRPGGRVEAARRDFRAGTQRRNSR